MKTRLHKNRAGIIKSATILLRPQLRMGRNLNGAGKSSKSSFCKSQYLSVV